MKKPKTLETFFTPKSVAVIGASDKKGSVGHTVFKNLEKAGVNYQPLKGLASQALQMRGLVVRSHQETRERLRRRVKKIYPVNPKHRSIRGRKCFASLSEIEGNIGLAVIAVPAKTVPKVLEECVEKKLGAVIIITAGFSETGEKKLTGTIASLIKKNPQTRVMGPNCVGILDNYSGLDTTFFNRDRMKIPKRGNLSFISQSGALGSMILDWTATQRIGINKFASYGNAMDVDESDLLEYLGSDRKTRVIAAYMEGAKYGRKFYDTAKIVSKKKPIIILKGGKTSQTTNAAASHTGTLAGSAQVYDAAFEQAGIIQADGLLDLFSISKLLSEEPLPSGKRVQVITNGGGFGIVTADQLVKHGLELSKLSKKTVKKLREDIPMASIGNPVDILGDADASRYEKAVKTIIKDRGVDILIVLALFNLPALEASEMAFLRRKKRRAKKPVIVVALGSEYTEKCLDRIEKAGFTTFNYPSAAARAIRGMVEYAEFRRKN